MLFRWHAPVGMQRRAGWHRRGLTPAGGGDMVRPALQGDGGDITLIKIENNDIYVRLVGACNTCPSSIMTMKMGVEALLRARPHALHPRAPRRLATHAPAVGEARPALLRCLHRVAPLALIHPARCDRRWTRTRARALLPRPVQLPRRVAKRGACALCPAGRFGAIRRRERALCLSASAGHENRRRQDGER